jgi:hypothetical protein
MRTRRPLSIVAAIAIAAMSDAASARACTQPLDVLGNAAPAGAAVDQTIVITDETRYVNVTSGTTVQFIAGKNAFAWTFQNGLQHIVPFDLNRIAPKGFLTHPVKAYVADDPLYQN